MRFFVLTIFPEMIERAMSESIIGRAKENNILDIEAVNIRDYTLDKHGKTDDYPYGGGAGMVMTAQPIYDAHKSITERVGHPIRTIYTTPQGRTFDQAMAREFAREEELIILCGHYEGVDERVLEEVVTDNVSIGDYVLTGGELPAMVMMDAISRMVPGVLTNELSGEDESFSGGLLEYPQYTRPQVWNGREVPDILLSGHHAKVDKWRRQQSILRTYLNRPELISEERLSKEEKKFLREIKDEYDRK